MKAGMASAVVAVCLAAATEASAHHSFAVYDLASNVELTGTVGMLKFRNPHLEMTLIAAGEPGQEPIVYTLEGAPANMLLRLGLEPSMIQPGTLIRVIAAPGKDDPNSWLVKAIILQDGTRFQVLT